MKKQFLKTASIILALIMLCTTFPLITFAKTEYTSGYYTYTVENDEATITNVDSSISGRIYIPSTLGGYPVKNIGASAFSYCQKLTSVIMYHIENIDSEAFYWCQSLTRVSLGESIINIGDSAFYNCSSLTAVSVGYTLKNIGNYAFSSGTNIDNVYYAGREEEWNSIVVGKGNNGLLNATVNYNRCGYSEFIHEHEFTTIVTPPTCTNNGFTTYSCSKDNYSYTSNYIEKLSHSYISSITTPPTHTTEGVKTFSCSCGDSYTETIAKLTGHTYDAVVTAPTCTQKGFTTYTCACGDTYVADYVDATGHSHTSEITTPATHTTEGVMTYTCACGDSYTEPVAKLEGHTYEAVVTAPTCKDKGFTTYTCACGDSYTGDFTEVIDHSDKDGNNVCDDCESSTKKDTTSLASSFFKNFIAALKAFLTKVVEFFSCKY